MTDEIEQEPAEEATPEEEATEVALTPTPAAEWPSKDKLLAGVVVELPSGGVARLSRPPLQYYISTGGGNFPPRLWKKVEKEGAKVFDDLVKNFSNEERKLFIDWMISCAFVDPKVSMARKAGPTYIGDLDDNDKEEVMRLLGLSLAG